ncbi:response regulator transcription factor [Humibacter ginsenosidimutans]|uniref:Response regulator transcription factor n=1 Tax=Humibacter ginsenosidimutans TaxID=2599293 RepID=A0A5B8M530_9MICO|nr:response regulator transcription factor [Humibacter ginsenosidimutans]QDZ15838.1 response regulator transcription factor [Humibacter ginsenosidimutans]
MIRVLIADDQALIRSAVVALLRHEDDVEVVGEASDGSQAVAIARREHPDVVLMDLRMPGTDGIAATRQIRADDGLDSVRVLVLTTFEDEENVLSALRAGAAGFLGKGADPVDIVRAVRTVHAGDELLSPTATRTLIRRSLEAPQASGPARALPPDLTERETEILALVGRGLSNDEIATALFISPATAKTHINRAMTKLGAHDRAQLVIAAYESGLIAPGSE